MLLTIWSGAAAYGRVAAAVETNQPLLAMLEIRAPRESGLGSNLKSPVEQSTAFTTSRQRRAEASGKLKERTFSSIWLPQRAYRVSRETSRHLPSASAAESVASMVAIQAGAASRMRHSQSEARKSAGYSNS